MTEQTVSRKKLFDLMRLGPVWEPRAEPSAPQAEGQSPEVQSSQHPGWWVYEGGLEAKLWVVSCTENLASAGRLLEQMLMSIGLDLQGGAMWCGLSDKAKKSDQPLQLQEEIGHQLLEREERPPVLLMLGLRSYQMLSGLEENDLQTMPFAEPQTLQIAGSGYKAVVIPALKDLREQPLLKRQAWRGLLAVSDLLQ